MAASNAVGKRVEKLDWDRIVADLDHSGWAITGGPVLSASETKALRKGFDDDALYRQSINLARHNFGEGGNYRYFANPLSEVITDARQAIYPHLADLANLWAERLGDDVRYPLELDAFLEQCHAAGQERPTPLILSYETNGWNALHQDIYGAIAFPMQIAIALTQPGEDFTGGENIFVEQRPRSQSRGSSVLVPRGHGVIFSTRHRPMQGRRGYYRCTMRHGVSTVTSGERMTLGIIFHDAE